MIDEILAKLKEAQPEYVATLPFSKKKVTYSPFKIKDQKTLSLIAEEQHIGMVLKNLCQLVRQCSSEKQPELLQLCDFEYLFLQIRAKSVEEKINLVLEEEIPLKFTININEIGFSAGEDTKRLSVGPNILVELAQPVVKDYFELDTLDLELLLPKILKVITIDKHRYDLSLLQTPDLKKLSEEIHLKQAKEFKAFLENAPKLSYVIKHQEREIKIEGFLRFFI